MKPGNPYNPKRHKGLPFVIERALVSRLVQQLLRGGGHMLLGGHGSGKSTSLVQIQHQLAKLPDVTVLRFSRPAHTLDSAHGAVCRELKISLETDDAPRAVERWLADHPDRHLVLLFDEYVPDEGVGRAFFNALEPVIREQSHLAVLAAGGVKMMRLKVIGDQSPFWSRATKVDAEPFTAEELAQMAKPFAPGLSKPILEMLERRSGGNPFLVAFCLAQLWRESPVTLAALERILEETLFDETDFVATFHQVLDADRPDSPVRLVWDHISERVGDQIPLSELTVLCRQGDPADFEPKRVLKFLQASGLIRCQIRRTHAVVQVIDSVLLPEALSEPLAHRSRLVRIRQPLLMFTLDAFLPDELREVLRGEASLAELEVKILWPQPREGYAASVIDVCTRHGVVVELLERMQACRRDRAGELAPLLKILRGS